MHPTGAKIKERRLARKVSPDRIADEIGISRARYYIREREGKLSEEELGKIAKLLNCSADELRPPARAGVSAEQAALSRDIVRGMQVAIQKYNLDLSPDEQSELFDALYRVFTAAGTIDSGLIDTIAKIKKGASP